MSKPAAPEILCLGCAGVGKTSLIKQLKQLKQLGQSSASAADAAAAFEPEEPTVGVELDRMTLGDDRTAAVIREVGAAMMATWPSYVPACRCLMFVVDRSNHAQLASAAAELHKLIALLPAATPVVVVLNKCDRSEVRRKNIA